MKKRILLATIPCLLLSACNLFSFSKEEKDEGFSDGNEHGSRVVEYMDNGVLDEWEVLNHKITFLPNETNSKPELKDEAAVKGIMVDGDSVVTSIENIAEVGQFHGLKVGNLSDAIDGKIKFNFSCTFNSIKIIARPRAAEVATGLSMESVIDKDVAVSVNNSKYIKVKDDFTNIEDITNTELIFKLNESASYIDINVAYTRVEIMEIDLY